MLSMNKWIQSIRVLAIEKTLRNSSTNRMNRMMIKWTWKKEGKLKERKKSAIIKTNQANKSSSLSLLFVFTKLRIWEFLSFFLLVFEARSNRKKSIFCWVFSFVSHKDSRLSLSVYDSSCFHETWMISEQKKDYYFLKRNDKKHE